MYFKGFKIAVSTNFLILLCIGMMLTNIVVTFLWQQHTVNLSVNNARTYLSLVKLNQKSFCGKNTSIATVHEALQRTIPADSVFSFIMLNHDDIYVSNKKIDSNVKTVLQQAGQLNSTVLKTTGSFLSILGLSAKNIIIAVPVEDCDTIETIGAVVHIPDITRVIRDKQSLILVYILVNAIILTTLWFFRARRLVIDPLERLVEMSDSYDLKSADYIGTTARKNEFGQLADALKNMLARIEKDKEKLTQTVHSLEDANKQILDNQKSLIEAEKFAAIGRLSAGLAHEIGNPLGIIQGYIELLSNDDIAEEDRRQYSKRAEKELNRVTTLIQNLLELARKKSEGKSSTRVLPVIHELIEMFAQQKSTQHITFNTTCDDYPERVPCSEAELHQVLLNCMLNSVDAINERSAADGNIDVSCKLIEEDFGNAVQIIINDDGSGIEQKDLSAIFDPFFTTKAIGYGTGLGLSVTRSIIENCGGTIRLQSDENTGTSVIIVLPVV